MLKCLKQEKTGLNRHKKPGNHASFSPENHYRAAVADMLSEKQTSLSRRCGEQQIHLTLLGTSAHTIRHDDRVSRSLDVMHPSWGPSPTDLT